MRSLKTIQTLSKIGKILSKIVFIFCIVGFCFCAAGIISLACGLQTLKFGDFELKSFLQNEAGVSTGTLYASMALGMVFCAGEAVLAKFAEHYFSRETADGTPFTAGGAKELQRLGILAICIPVGTQITASIVHSIFEHAMSGVAAMDISSSGSISLGIMFIVMAQLCKYGAELRGGKEEGDLTEEK